MCPSPARNNDPDNTDLGGRGGRKDLGFRFPRHLSLKGRIREGLRTFKRRSGKNLTVFYNLRAAQGVSLDFAEALKWVFMVPKRTGTAITRNRIRRQIREIARLWIGRKNLSGEIMVRYESAGKQTSDQQALPTQVEVKEELLGILAKILSETCEN